MFLLRDGSFTLMKMASLMFLAMLLSSLPTIVKLSRETSWPVVFWWSMMGDGALMCSLYLSPNVLLLIMPKTSGRVVTLNPPTTIIIGS